MRGVSPVTEKSRVPDACSKTDDLVRCLSSFLWFAVFAVFCLAACGTEGVPPLIEVRDISPRQVEVGDRIEVTGSGFPQGRMARVAFRGTLYRPGQSPAEGIRIETEGTVISNDRIEVPVSEVLEERFCGFGDRAVHATLSGEVEVAFSSRTPGAPPLVGVLTGMTLDVMPASVRASIHEARSSEGSRVLAFLGITPGTPSARGIPVEQVAPGSNAELAGFENGDQIVAVDGARVRELADIAPVSARSTRIAVMHPDSAVEEMKSLSMAGYASERIPAEFVPAFLVVGLALAVLLFLVFPNPTIALSLELRVSRLLRAQRDRAIGAVLFGRNAARIVSALMTVLLGTFALGPHVVSVDLDVAILVIATVATLFVGRTGAWQQGWIRAAADAVLLGLVLVGSVAGVLVYSGALRLSEIVRGQGGAPWEFAALRHPAPALFAFVYVGVLIVLLRPRETSALLAQARVETTSEVKRRPGELRDRCGLLVASSLGTALFFGGWQVPFVVASRSLPFLLAGALIFIVKTWCLVAVVRAIVSLASPWTVEQARAFTTKRLLPALGVGGILVVLSQKLPQTASLEAGFGLSVLTASALLLVRLALRVRGAMLRAEPHASPFL